MGRIQSSVGLITGTDIVGTVEQLIAISARPRDRLLSRTALLQPNMQNCTLEQLGMYPIYIYIYYIMIVKRI